MFSYIFGGSSSSKHATADKEPPVTKGMFGGTYGPKEKLSKSEIKKLNRYWARNINKRDMHYQEFINLAEWHGNPLVPRALEVLNSGVKESKDLSKSPTVRLQDFINVYEKLRNYQPRSSKMEFAFKLLDFDGDGRVNEGDIVHFLMTVTGISEDACRYHASEILEGRPAFTRQEFEENVPLIQLCARFDLPQPPG
ncbi:unnamed protein product [Amoebophrya sp. A25]|nr:unnamed protein product [Amoebophrya sp. A25]|eukprot:GSA25T00011877001.1